MHFTALGRRLGGEGEARFGLRFARRGEGGGDSPDFGAVLEAVARSAADQHDIGVGRVAVDQKVAVRAILILANPAFGQRCVA